MKDDYRAQGILPILRIAVRHRPKKESIMKISCTPVGLSCIFIIALSLICSPLYAQEKTEKKSSEETVSIEQPVEPAAAPETSSGYDFWTSKKATGDWGGARSDLKDQGISISVRNMVEYMVNMHGGRETKNGSDFAGSYDFNIYLDLEKMNLIPGGSLYFQAKGSFGGEASDFDREKIGALYKTNQDSGIEEPVWIDKWWWQQKLFDDKLEFVLGRLSTVKDYIDMNKVAGHEDKQFMNNALVRNPTIPHKNGIAAFVKYEPVDWFYVLTLAIDPQAVSRRTGFDTAFHGSDRIRLFTEAGFVPEFDSSNGGLTGHYRFGMWYEPYAKEVFRDTLGGALADRYRSGDTGYYFGFDQMVWKENNDQKDNQGITVFGRYGFAREDVNRVEHFWAAGGQYLGLIPGRDKDVVAFGVAQAILSDQYRAEVDSKADRETVYELYYACQVTPWCFITPDLQFITNAGGDEDDPNAFVAGLRVRVEL